MNDDEPRWDHHQHYDMAIEKLDRVNQIVDPTAAQREAQVATAHALLAVYRLLQENR